MFSIDFCAYTNIEGCYSTFSRVSEIKGCSSRGGRTRVSRLPVERANRYTSEALLSQRDAKQKRSTKDFFTQSDQKPRVGSRDWQVKTAVLKFSDQYLAILLPCKTSRPCSYLLCFPKSFRANKHFPTSL